MRELLEQGWGITVVFGIAGIGVIVRMLLLGYYGMLGRACGHFEDTGNKTIMYIRTDLMKRAERKQEIKNVLTYTEYRLAERRVCGFRIGSLEGMVAYSMLLTGMSCVLLFMASAFLECGTESTLNLLFSGGTSIACMIVLDAVTGLQEKKKRMRLRLRDYIENSWTENKEVQQKERRKKKEETFGKREKRKNRSVDKPKKAGKKTHGKAQEEKRRLTEELLRERRQLEARSLAEQRRKEREETIPEQEGLLPADMAEQVQEEAAVTELSVEQVKTEARAEGCPDEQIQAEAVATESPTEQEEMAMSKCRELSYEDLLNEFLKEYPA